MHKLKKRTTKEQSQNVRNKSAEDNARKRKEIRQVYMELSRYFEVPAGCKEWMCPQLLLRGKHHRGRSQ